MRLPLRIFICACALALGLAASTRPVAPVFADDKKYGDGTDGLKALWDEVLKSAQAGDEKAVTASLEGLAMSEDDFKAVLADPATATAFAEKYKAAHAKGWARVAKGLVSKTKGEGYDAVTAIDVTGDKKEQRGENARVMQLLKPGVKMYSVRLTKTGENKGASRFDCFFYVNGKWVAGWKLANFMEKAKAPAPPAKPAADGAKPDDKKDGDKKPDGLGG